MLSNGNQFGHYYLQLINSMQILVYLPLLNIRIPASVMTLLKLYRPVVQFDAMSGLDGTKLSLAEQNIWNEDDSSYSDQNFSDQMGDLGFEQLHSLLNLGGFSIFLYLYFLKLFICLVMYVTVIRPCGKCKQRVDGQLRKALFNEILVMTIETSLDMTIASYL